MNRCRGHLAELAACGRMLAELEGEAFERVYREERPGELEAERPELSPQGATAVLRLGWDTFAAVFLPCGRILVRASSDACAELYERKDRKG